ncbi:MAG: type II secretion system protein GspG [Armatimonadetes bacterium]|nr:type II secretion system protein GspG [Armatimonadota bacterium]
MSRFLRSKVGFSLVELLVVIVVLAILAAIVLPKLVGANTRNKEQELRSCLQLLRNAVQAFYAHTGVYPIRLSDLSATSAPPIGLSEDGFPKPINPAKWRGPYVDSIPSDPVSGRPFIYITSKPNVGRIQSSALGNSVDGKPYSEW